MHAIDTALATCSGKAHPVERLPRCLCSTFPCLPVFAPARLTIYDLTRESS